MFVRISIMKVIILYRPQSEHGRLIETFIRDFKMRNSDVRLDELNVDSREGAALASLYDIVQYPAILAVGNDGSLRQLWEGANLPLMDEVAAYAYSGQ